MGISKENKYKVILRKTQKGIFRFSHRVDKSYF